jgi:acylphosphatase
MTARAHVIFKGKVQGVWFRANTQQKAVELGVNGWVRNLNDGSVEAVFEGEKSLVEEVIDWCSHHQPYARVTEAEVHWESARNEFNKFEIKR